VMLVDAPQLEISEMLAGEIEGVGGAYGAELGNRGNHIIFLLKAESSRKDRTVAALEDGRGQSESRQRGEVSLGNQKTKKCGINGLGNAADRWRIEAGVLRTRDWAREQKRRG